MAGASPAMVRREGSEKDGRAGQTAYHSAFSEISSNGTPVTEGTTYSDAPRSPSPCSPSSARHDDPFAVDDLSAGAEQRSAAAIDRGSGHDAGELGVRFLIDVRG